MTPSRLLAALPAAALFALALALRLHQHHDALMYPDGYQYLLMARGIGEHLEPTTVLGPGGDVFVPNPDAAAKPLFPIVVAAVHRSASRGWTLPVSSPWCREHGS